MRVLSFIDCGVSGNHCRRSGAVIKEGRLFGQDPFYLHVVFLEIESHIALRPSEIKTVGYDADQVVLWRASWPRTSVHIKIRGASFV